MRRPGSERGRNFGHELGRPAERDLRAELGQQMARGTGHAAVVDVADNRNLQSLERFLVLQDREGIEQSLGRMLVHAVAGIDDGNVEVLRHQVRRARGGMANHDGVRAHRAQRVAGVEQRFALLDARSRGLHQGGDGAQRLGGDLERRPRARGSFVKQQHDALVAQQRTRLERIHPAGQLQQAQDFLVLQVLDAEQ